MTKVKAKKHLGQHFLKDENIAIKTVALLQETKKTVIEIGPGMGMLTKYLIEKNVLLQIIEIDQESVKYLKINYPELKDKIKRCDFLKLNIQQEFENNISIIGNFPYNISSQIIFKILKNKNQINEVVGMFQKEVAERLVAKKGRKRGILSVFTQAFYNIEYCFTINENVFFPKPKVKSAVIRLERNNRLSLACNEELFFKIIKTSFNQRRKTLKNALKSFNLLNTKEISEFLTRRAEELTVENFINITLHVQKNK